MIDIKIVHNDDWQALYCNSVKIADGHKIEIYDVLNAIKKYYPNFNFTYNDIYIYSDDDCEFEYPIDFDRLNIKDIEI